MRILISATIACVLSGCATKPHSFETSSTVGRVSSAAKAHTAPGSSRSLVAPLMIGGTLVPITVGTVNSEVDVFAYAITPLSGKTIVTNSTTEFSVGDCVRLWHPPLAPFTENQRYNFVAGTLKKDVSC
jgi:starvation-inducible outer membrane lipoprotein